MTPPDLEITEDGATVRSIRTHRLRPELSLTLMLPVGTFIGALCLLWALSSLGSPTWTEPLVLACIAASIACVGLAWLWIVLGRARQRIEVSIRNGRLSWRTWLDRHELALQEIEDLEQHPTGLRIVLRSGGIRWVPFPTPNEATSRFLGVVRRQMEVAREGAAAAER